MTKPYSVFLLLLSPLTMAVEDSIAESGPYFESNIRIEYRNAPDGHDGFLYVENSSPGGDLGIVYLITVIRKDARGRRSPGISFYIAEDALKVSVVGAGRRQSPPVIGVPKKTYEQMSRETPVNVETKSVADRIEFSEQIRQMPPNTPLERADDE